MDGCTMRGLLSPTFSDISVVKMENDLVISSKPIFYHRFVDDLCSRGKLGDNNLNNYHSTLNLP